MRRGPSKPKGLVTTATVSASSSLASEATTGAAPVPVPPPKPGGDEDHVGALQHLDDAVGIFQRGLPADLRVAPAPSPLVILAPSCSLLGTSHGVSACTSVFMA